MTFIRFGLAMTEPGGILVPLPPREDQPDLVPDSDADGRPHIPGTSLAGALRELVWSRLGVARADGLFGCLLDTAVGGAGRDTVDAVASPIWVYGARLAGDMPVPVERSSTAIDRHRGAARNLTLRTEHLLPAGTRFQAYLRWDGAAQQDLDDVLALIAGWQPLLGHGTSRGRGRCTVGPIHHGTLDLDDQNDLLTWLTRSGPELVERVATTEVTVTADTAAPIVQLPIEIRGPLRVGNGRTTGGGAGPKVAEIRCEGGQPLIPGSGLKGVVRSRAEYILRSVGGDACDDQRCGTCRPCQLFGHSRSGDKPDGAGARSRFRFRDAVVSDPCVRERTHVAIDRFTGGAAGRTPDPDGPAGEDPDPAGDPAGNADPTGRGLLYTVRALERGAFTLTVETLTVEPLDAADDDRDDLLALLRLVAEDLNDGLTGIGGGTARGYGSVEVDTTSLPLLADARVRLVTMIATRPTNGEAHD